MEELQYSRESSWLQFRCTACDCLQLLWLPMLMKRWLKITTNGDQFSAGEHEYSEDEDDDTGSDSELDCEGGTVRKHPDVIRRCQSETFHRQYTSTEEFRIAAGTWNVAGRTPPPHLNLHDWLGMNDPADIYVLGFQEIVALNAGNVLCAEDNKPAIKWQAIIHEALNKVNQSKYNCYSACPSPLREQMSDVSDAVVGDAEIDAECLVIDEETSFTPLKLCQSTPIRTAMNVEPNFHEVYKITEQIGLSSLRTKPEPMNCLLASDLPDDRGSAEEDVLARPLLSPVSRVLPSIRNPVKKRVQYVCVASKQMVGIYITVWVRKKLRRFIRSVTVSRVGLGLMGCLGNKGSISVSMMLYQTSLCFICSHLSSGDEEGDEFRRNADIMGTLKRTCFPTTKAVDAEIPNTIWGHDCIIWLGDLNYRLSLPDSEIRFLVAREDWPALLGKDQLRKEFREGHVFEGWHEGTISFAPTYKYDMNSGHYAGESVNSGEKRRSPAWCDRIVWYGKGLKQLSYTRQESTLSDHKPVNAVFLVEVEVFSECKSKRN